MKHIIILLLLIVFATGLSAQTQKNEYPFKEKYSFNGSDCDLDADIEIDEQNLEAGKRYSVKYTINIGTFCPLYNPFFNSLISHPGQLALYDENKNYVMNLTKWTGGSRRSPSRSDWVFMSGGSFIGSKRSFIFGDSFLGRPTDSIKEGTYFLQMIFYESFYSTPWEDKIPEEDVSSFYKTYTTDELFRSNALKINIKKTN